MARVFIDAHMFGEKWFLEILDDLRNRPKVRFAYSSQSKIRAEMELIREALRFLKLMGELNRRDDVDAVSIERAILDLKAQSSWPPCSDCDDEHIFALVCVLPTPYVFSKDKRLSRCRDTLSGRVSAAYCRFSRVESKKIFMKLRSKIIS